MNVAAVVSMLRATARFVIECDAFDERAAIMEFCGGLPREEAERLAFKAAFGLPPDRFDPLEAIAERGGSR